MASKYSGPAFPIRREVKTGSPLRRHWRAACKAAGLDGLLLHDLRRSAVKNIIESDIHPALAKQIIGHKSDSVFERYSIKNAESLKRASAKLGARMTERATKVVPLKRGDRTYDGRRIQALSSVRHVRSHCSWSSVRGIGLDRPT